MEGFLGDEEGRGCESAEGELWDVSLGLLA